MNLQASPQILALSLAAALEAFTGCAATCWLPERHARTVIISEVPPSVLESFGDKFPGATVVWIGAFVSGTNTAYSFQFSQAGKSLAVGVDTFGDVGSAYEPLHANPTR